MLAPCIAAARCGFDEGEMATMLMSRPIMAAILVFDFIQERGYTHDEKSLRALALHFSSAFKALGGDTTAVFDEWSRLSRM